MNENVLAIQQLLDGVDNHWQPMIINKGDFDFRLVKFSGEFEWHCHKHSDKVILVVAGEMAIRFANQDDVVVKAGEIYVLPKGVLHQPYAIAECHIVLIELAGRGK